MITYFCSVNKSEKDDFEGLFLKCFYLNRHSCSLVQGNYDNPEFKLYPGDLSAEMINLPRIWIIVISTVYVMSPLFNIHFKIKQA